MYALSVASRNFVARARGSSDKSDPEMIPKSPEITQRGGREIEGLRAGRPALRCGAGLQIRRSIPALSSRPAPAIGRSFSPRETHTYTRAQLSRRLNIPDAYHDNNSVAIVALFD